MGEQTPQVSALDAIDGDRATVSKRARELLEIGSEPEFLDWLGR